MVIFSFWYQVVEKLLGMQIFNFQMKFDPTELNLCPFNAVYKVHDLHVLLWVYLNEVESKIVEIRKNNVIEIAIMNEFGLRAQNEFLDKLPNSVA